MLAVEMTLLLLLMALGETFDNAVFAVRVGQCCMLALAVVGRLLPEKLAVSKLITERFFCRLQGQQVLHIQRARLDRLAQRLANLIEFSLQSGQPTGRCDSGLLSRRQLPATLIALDLAHLQHGF
jgi:hypothetical protein